MFIGASGMPFGGWTNLGICVGKPAAAEALVPLCVAIAPELAALVVVGGSGAEDV